MKTGRRHSNHRERAAIDQETSVHDRRVCSEAALPVAEAQDHNRICIGYHIIRRNKKPSPGRLQAEHVEVISRDQFSCDQLRLVSPLHTDLCPGGRDQTAEYRVVIAEVAIHRIREREILIRAGIRVATESAGRLQNNEAITILDRQPAQKRLIEQTEDRRIGADAERKRDNCDRCKSRRLGELPQRITKIFTESSHHRRFCSITRNVTPPWDRPWRRETRVRRLPPCPQTLLLWRPAPAQQGCALRCHITCSATRTRKAARPLCQSQSPRPTRPPHPATPS